MKDDFKKKTIKTDTILMVFTGKLTLPYYL